MLKRRTLLGTSLATVMAPAIVKAQDTWPNRPIRLVVPYAPGGVSDAVGRLFAHGMQEKLGQPVVVENRGGANGTIGSDTVAKSHPDGYSFLLVVSAHVINPWIMPAMPYKPLEDLRCVSVLTRVPMLAVSSATLPAKDLKEFNDYARAAREPLLYGSSGLGSGGHLITEMYTRAAGIMMQHVPYRGISPALPDLISGRVALIFDTIQTMLPLIEAGRIRALGLAADERWSAAPNIPTLTEAGVPFKAASWFSMVAPRQTPDGIVNRMQQAITHVLSLSDTKEKLLGYGMTAGGETPAACDMFLQSEYERLGRVAREANIRIDG